MNELKTRKILLIEDAEILNSEIMTKILDELEKSLWDFGILSVRAVSYTEAEVLIASDMDLDCIAVSSDMLIDKKENAEVIELMRKIRKSHGEIPIFLFADRSDSSAFMSQLTMELANEYVWIFEDSPTFIAGRINAAIIRYRKNLLPPLFKSVYEYNENYHEYSWAAPGHQGGVGFSKTPAGKKFLDFYGENLFRTDTGIERSSIGSLLDHEGTFRDSERIAAKVFGADESYSVISGTSGSNRTIMQGCIVNDELIICDRNCHKSIEQGMILTGAIPIYMLPSRNVYGIIGPIPRAEMMSDSITEKISALPNFAGHKKGDIVYSVVTNCTYDGICYNAAKVEDELAKSVDRIHFDEAWYGYARFNEMYEDHYAMRGDPKEHKGATIFATHSTHKLLCALSQASYIHIRQGANGVPFNHFNQSYMLNATTSPLYAICVSNDVAVDMMATSGEVLTQEVIDEAIDFRQALASMYREFKKEKTWFFKPWNAEKVYDERRKRHYDFADAPKELLAYSQSCWKLNSKDKWHGFTDIEDDWAMLDPIKVSILSPGINLDGTFEDTGVPAELVASYLYYHGIIPTRSTDFQLMFLFSMGITKGKWGTLLNTLLNFKEHYDNNAPISEVLPELAKDYPEIYGETGVKDLGDEMFDYIKRENPTAKLNSAFAELPEIAMLPRDAYNKIVKKEVELIPSSKLAGRIAANSLIPYPPGIPLIMSGERFGDSNSVQIEYLKALEKWDSTFPGFEHETEGAEKINGEYCVLCVKE